MSNIFNEEETGIVFGVHRQRAIDLSKSLSVSDLLNILIKSDSPEMKNLALKIAKHIANITKNTVSIESIPDPIPDNPDLAKIYIDLLERNKKLDNS